MVENTFQNEETKSNDRIRLGTIFGLPVFFNYSFLFWFALIIFVEPINLILFLSLLFFSILIHELAHGLTSKYLGLGSGTVTIWFLGGFFIPFNEESIVEMTFQRRIRYVLMILAGPLSNLLIAGLLLLLAKLSSMDDFYSASKYNISLFILNLLPIGQLDGGQIVKYLASGVLHWRKTVYITGILAFILAVIVFVGLFFENGLGRYANWAGFLIGMGIGTIKLSKKTDEEIEEETKKVIAREIAITQKTNNLKGIPLVLSLGATIGIICILGFSVVHLFTKYQLYKDLTGHILYTDFDRNNRETYLFITQKLGYPTVLIKENPYHKPFNYLSTTYTNIAVFICYLNSDNNNLALCVNDLAGEAVAKIPVSIKEISDIYISPDAKRVAISSLQDGIHIVDIETREISQLFNNGFFESWSPNGEKILITKKNDNNIQIFQMNVLSGSIEEITQPIANANHLFYSPDGRYIYIASPNNEENNIYRMDVNGGNLGKISIKNHIYINPEMQISPDGEKIVFQCNDYGKYICLINLITLEEKVLALGDYPVWSPDNKYLAYLSEDDEIVIVSSDGKKTIKLKPLQRFSFGLAWLP